MQYELDCEGLFHDQLSQTAHYLDSGQKWPKKGAKYLAIIWGVLSYK